MILPLAENEFSRRRAIVSAYTVEAQNMKFITSAVRAKKKPININIFGGTVSGTNRNRPWDKWDPSQVPGTKWDPSLGQTSLSLFNSTVKPPFYPVCPWDRWGFVLG